MYEIHYSQYDFCLTLVQRRFPDVYLDEGLKVNFEEDNRVLKTIKLFKKQLLAQKQEVLSPKAT